MLNDEDESTKTEMGMSFVALLNPLSRGSITLNSSDAFDKPIIDANYLDEVADWQPMA